MTFRFLFKGYSINIHSKKYRIDLFVLEQGTGYCVIVRFGSSEEIRPRPSRHFWNNFRNSGSSCMFFRVHVQIWRGRWEVFRFNERRIQVQWVRGIHPLQILQTGNEKPVGSFVCNSLRRVSFRILQMQTNVSLNFKITFHWVPSPPLFGNRLP